MWITHYIYKLSTFTIVSKNQKKSDFYTVYFQIHFCLCEIFLLLA